MTDPTGAELDALLYDDDEVLDLEEPAPLPPDLGRAGWHARKADVILSDASAARELFDSEIAGIVERRDAMLDRASREALWHEKAVEGWHRASLRDGSVGKTVEFPNGRSSSLRAAQPKTEIVDEDALRAWLSVQRVEGQGPRIHTMEDLVFPVKEPVLSRAALKKCIQIVTKKSEPGSIVPAVNPDTGETVPGVEFRSMPENHNLKGKS